MNFETATFRFSQKNGGPITVEFAGDSVTVATGSKTVSFRNVPAKWGGRPYKPRVTDCKRLISRFVFRGELSECAEERIKADKVEAVLTCANCGLRAGWIGRTRTDAIFAALADGWEGHRDRYGKAVAKCKTCKDELL